MTHRFAALVVICACAHHGGNTTDATDDGSSTSDACNDCDTIHTFPTGSLISYLGGHQYSMTVPVASGSQSQGTRLFLNALFEAQCVTGP
ncbi:MAG TPA: hypothetical protein VFQ65_07450 [Kofleriaceae bacterium]|nr:hypothetical protein [Kofleriaceae bacterium]